ncbi:hypothetical protein Fcan01_02537 [Folsomia candida]|uniref:Uncharacterized protein n=1 Tax=Folsomia candida TaxID=158441 RepID=A0A226EUT1_FOLCA|nr:hypothetical protein Fcan01_02537 [Folsomia candida]
MKRVCNSIFTILLGTYLTGVLLFVAGEDCVSLKKVADYEWNVSNEEKLYLPIGQKNDTSIVKQILYESSLNPDEDLTKLCHRIQFKNESVTISGVNGTVATFSCSKLDDKKWIWDCKHDGNKSEYNHKLYTTFTDKKTFALVVRCWASGLKGWSVVSTKKFLHDDVQIQILEHVKSLGFETADSLPLRFVCTGVLALKGKSINHSLLKDWRASWLTTWAKWTTGNKCDRKISRVKITIAQQQLSNCFLSDDTPGKEICEVTIPSPSVVESEKLVLPDATTQQPNTDDVISKTVSTNEIVAVNPPIKLDEKLSDDIHAITNPAIVEAIEESPQELAPQKLEELPQKLEASESPQNVEESEFPQKVDKSPQKLEASESPQKLEELPQQLKKLPQKLEESESSQKLGETFQVEQTQPLAAKFYHLKRLSKYFTKEELADVKEWMGRTCTNMTEAERTIVCRYRLHQILEEKTFADFFWDSIRK